MKPRLSVKVGLALVAIVAIPAARYARREAILQRSHSCLVLGEVARPGPIPAGFPDLPTLAEAIRRAGGLKPGTGRVMLHVESNPWTPSANLKNLRIDLPLGASPDWTVGGGSLLIVTREAAPAPGGPRP